jgi:cadmium resistance protein CadD (predicted permease)
VAPLGATLATAATLFAGTNVDDLIVLAVLHAASRPGVFVAIGVYVLYEAGVLR